MDDAKFNAMTEVARTVPRQGGSPRGRVQRTWRKQDEAFAAAGFTPEDADAWHDRFFAEQTARMRREADARANK